MRASITLDKGWWVSAAPRDAALAARRHTWRPDELRLGAEPDNHPRQIDLSAAVSGPHTDYGKREGVNGQRVPSPYLSYAKQVRIPARWSGHTVRLLLDNARYHVTARVNGRKVAHYVGGLEPHRVDITRFVTPGKTALLLITVGDSGVSGHRRFDPYAYTGTRLPTCEEIRDNLVHPVIYGGADRAVGFVALEAVPPIRTEYAFADPKVSSGTLNCTLCLRNESARRVRVHVTSRAVGTKTLISEEVTLNPRSTKKIRRAVAWADAILWDTDHPHLYRLRTTLRTPARRLLDSHEDTFGFREFTVDGHSFFLNGKKIHLHGQSGHTSPDHDWMALEQKIAYLRAWKEQGHVNHIRLHARPQHREWVTAADRVGMLVTTETALWTTNFHSFDWSGSEDACYRNVLNHFLQALVRRDRNNPSVIIWSLSNEMSPITHFDREDPKMAAMTRVLEKIIRRTRREDGSRVIQMSSAMDFLGNLEMYNLHYPKNWQAFPDYPHTAYWLDGAFLFPWYGPHRHELPAWSWRKDKPLYFGEFTCVHGATPDSQASIVGDAAFEQRDFGTARVNEKLWPLEIRSYRRLDVSGFCAWSAMFPEQGDTRAVLARPEVAAHTRALRPVAVLDHSHRKRYFSGDEATLDLSVHNDTRHPLELELHCEVCAPDGRTCWTETMPTATYGPATIKTFTSRFRLPAVPSRTTLTYRVVLRSGRQVVDRWQKPVEVMPLKSGARLRPGLALYDPGGTIASLLRARGVRGAGVVTRTAAVAEMNGMRCFWISFGVGGAHMGDWEAIRSRLDRFVRTGGAVVLDHPPRALLERLPVPVKEAPGFGTGGQIELTYAYNAAPQHPATRGLDDTALSPWGEDGYLAHSVFDVPQEGNVIPLLVAGTAESGLVHSPLVEMVHGRGCYLLSSLEILEKLREAPQALDAMVTLAAYRPDHAPRVCRVCVGSASARILGEVGLGAGASRFDGTGRGAPEEVWLIDGDRLGTEAALGLKPALAAGATVCLHALSAAQTRHVLATLGLPGTVRSPRAREAGHDTFRHVHPLANGMSNNYLYWVVDKARLPPWSRAALHPEPATAWLRVPRRRGVWSLTKHGAVTVYKVGAGMLVIDNLRWELPDLDEPERPRRYLGRLLTNLGVRLGAGRDRRMSRRFETEAERRERGHF